MCVAVSVHYGCICVCMFVCVSVWSVSTNAWFVCLYVLCVMFVCVCVVCGLCVLYMCVVCRAVCVKYVSVSAFVSMWICNVCIFICVCCAVCSLCVLYGCVVCGTVSLCVCACVMCACACVSMWICDVCCVVCMCYMCVLCVEQCLCVMYICVYLHLCEYVMCFCVCVCVVWSRVSVCVVCVPTCVYVNVWCVFVYLHVCICECVVYVSGYYLYALYLLGNCFPMELNPVPRTFWAFLLRYSLLCFNKYLLKLKYEYAFWPLLEWLKTARMYHEENSGSAWWLDPHCQQTQAVLGDLFLTANRQLHRFRAGEALVCDSFCLRSVFGSKQRRNHCTICTF